MQEDKTHHIGLVRKNLVTMEYQVRIPKVAYLGSYFGTCTCGIPARDGMPCKHMVVIVKSLTFQKSPGWVSCRSFSQLSSGDASTQLKWCATLTSQWHRWSSWTPPWKTRAYNTARTGPRGRSLATQKRMTNIWQLWTTSSHPLLRSESIRRRCTARSVRSGITTQSSAGKIQSTTA